MRLGGRILYAIADIERFEAAERRTPTRPGNAAP
jgi:hypothetical protein